MSIHTFGHIGKSDRFSYGRYLDDLHVTIDTKTEYINATKLCQVGGKKLHENTSITGLIRYYNKAMTGHLECEYDITEDDLPDLSRDDRKAIIGTYYHKDLIVHIAIWIAPAIAFKISKIVNNDGNRLVRELRDTNKALLDKVDVLLSTNKEHLGHRSDSRREGVLIYRNKTDSKTTRRMICDTEEYLDGLKHNAAWYKEYTRTK